jgi:hypothetical protein
MALVAGMFDVFDTWVGAHQVTNNNLCLIRGTIVDNNDLTYQQRLRLTASDSSRDTPCHVE